jgi:hypothetical protein
MKIYYYTKSNISLRMTCITTIFLGNITVCKAQMSLAEHRPLSTPEFCGNIERSSFLGCSGQADFGNF